MKTSFILFVALLLSTAAFTQSSKLYHTYWNGTQEVFAYYDINTSSYVDLAPISGVRRIHLGESTFDKFNNRYFNTTDLGVTVIDAFSGSLVQTINKPSVLSGQSLMEHDRFNNILYACHWTGSVEILTSPNLFTDKSTGISLP